MKTRFIVRKFNQPLIFPAGGVVLNAPCDAEATGFGSREEAIDELRKRRMGHKGIAIVEVLASETVRATEWSNAESAEARRSQR